MAAPNVFNKKVLTIIAALAFISLPRSAWARHGDAFENENNGMRRVIPDAELTREIGQRIAVGARRRDIRNQFLLEAAALCILGGPIGILLGVDVRFWHLADIDTT